MASKKIFQSKAASNYFLKPAESTTGNNHPTKTTADSLLEFDESDIWNFSAAPTMEMVTRKMVPSSSRTTNKVARNYIEAGPVITCGSLPLNIPDWSQIYKGEHGEHQRKEGDCSLEDDTDYDDEDTDDHDGCRVPPHEFLARRRGASFSVHEGIGRTLKGRDLRQVRNAIWKKVGFED